MNNNQIAEKAPAFEFSQEIDGRVYFVRAFFKNEGETLQQKIEQMIERELMSLIKENVYETAPCIIYQEHLQNTIQIHENLLTFCIIWIQYMHKATVLRLATGHRRFYFSRYRREHEAP